MTQDHDVVGVLGAVALLAGMGIGIAAGIVLVVLAVVIPDDPTTSPPPAAAAFFASCEGPIVLLAVAYALMAIGRRAASALVGIGAGCAGGLLAGLVLAVYAGALVVAVAMR